MQIYYNGSYPQSIEILSDKVLLQVFGNKEYRFDIREKAVEVLADRESPQLVPPVLEFLNSIVDSDFDWEASINEESLPSHFVGFVGRIYTDEAYQGLKQFLHRLLTENPRHKSLFLASTVSSLVDVSVKLEMKDSVSVMKKVIPDLEDPQQVGQVLSRLVEYFNTFNEPTGIKEILIHHAADRMPEVETRCLELLQKHDSDFVREWTAQKASANTRNEESS